MFIKKFSIFALTLSMAALSFTGCGSSDREKGGNKSFSVVCTIFPEYDWVRQILGDNSAGAELTFLLDNGADLHNYQPTADDIIRISTCDLFIYVGGESDAWVDDALAQASNKEMKVIDLMDVLGENAKEEELKEGMQGEDEDAEEDEEEEEAEYDEHVWLSVKNAELFCTEIEGALTEIDPSNAAEYADNLDSYLAQLGELDTDFQSLADGARSRTLVFCDRFPFRYFTDDYGFDYYAAFIGCSAETEASFSTITFLADKINELGCDTVFTLEKSDRSIADTVLSTAGSDAEIAELDSLQSVTADDVNAGVTYVSLMRNNYDVLSAALN